MPAPTALHAVEPEALAGALRSNLVSGLSRAEAEQRLRRYGPNRLEQRRRPPYAQLAVRQVADPLVALLLVATLVSFAIGDTLEAAAIAAVLVLNAVLGFSQELAAERAILLLANAFTHPAVVLRDGSTDEVPAEEVVPGDILVVNAGDRVAADARVVDARSLEVDESALTGESLPVEKRPEALPDLTPLAERRSMLYAGTAVVRGRGLALVSATGVGTELGEIHTLTTESRPPPTPLERRLARLTKQMAVAGVLLTAGLGAAMLVRGEPLHTAFLVGVAVAVAAVPEGLAATVTAALALGAQALARRGAIVRRLDAIQTLGETTTICTDKTGTLTENEIRVGGLRAATGVGERELLEAAVLASAARVGDDGRVVGEPLERALLLAAMERGVSPNQLMATGRLVFEIPFDSDRKQMTTVYEHDGRRRVFTKGAHEAVAVDGVGDLDLVKLATAWAEEGFRVLAVAASELDDEAELDASVEGRGELVGVIAFHDPLRASAAGAIADARRAGIGVRMITGDHPATARTIGRALGLAENEVIARATPASKLELVDELQCQGEVVAVTGDGVNDAPALRRADVGVAMGRKGTEAAREAAAIVLTDDDFATIIAAVREGRRIGDNIRKFVGFLLSANLGEVLVFAAAIVLGLGAPLAVVQVLLVNLVTDGLPALALVQDPASPLTMTMRPRGGSHLFDRRLWVALGLVGLFVGAATFTAFLVGRSLGDGSAQTMAFATLALSELALVFGMRSVSVALWRMPPNHWLVASTLAAAALVTAAVYVPAAHEPLATVDLGAAQAAVVIALAVAPLVLVELLKACFGTRFASQQESGCSDPADCAASLRINHELRSALSPTRE